MQESFLSVDHLSTHQAATVPRYIRSVHLHVHREVPRASTCAVCEFLVRVLCASLPGGAVNVHTRTCLRRVCMVFVSASSAQDWARSPVWPKTNNYFISGRPTGLFFPNSEIFYLFIYFIFPWPGNIGQYHGGIGAIASHGSKQKQC